MLFHVYGADAILQWIAMLGVLAALILLNEFARRTKTGGDYYVLRHSGSAHGVFYCHCCRCGNGRRVGR